MLNYNLNEDNNSPTTAVNGNVGVSVSGIDHAGHSSSGVGAGFRGIYGTLTIQADGSFVYLLDNNDADTQALGTGDTGVDRFTYTYIVAGVEQVGTLTFTISGMDEVNQQVTISSSTVHIPAGTATGALDRLEVMASEGLIVDGTGIATLNGTIINTPTDAPENIGVSVGPTSGVINNGLISATRSSKGDAIGLYATGAQPITNNGVIHAGNSATGDIWYRAIGIETVNHTSTVTNTGLVEAISGGEAYGVWTGVPAPQVNNSGYIYVSGVAGDDPRSVTGIRSGQSSNANIVNSGTIEVVSSGKPSVGIYLFPDSTNIYSSGSITNSGRIVADTAIYAAGGYLISLSITNSNYIQGDLFLDVGNNIVVNTAGAQWHGDFQFGMNHDYLVNAGLIEGQVTLGNGDDSYDGRGGTLNGAVDAGSGNDLLIGGAGADHLSSSSGSNMFWGGGGADVLTSGSDADRFVYRSLSDSVTGAADRIENFQTGIDKIDISAFQVQSLTITPGGAVNIVTVTTAQGTLTIQVAGAITSSDFITTPTGSTVTGTDGPDLLYSFDNGVVFVGGAGDDAIHGTDGNDILDGGTGNDTLYGGAGDDIYYIERDGDRVIELADQGVDEVRSTADYSLQINTEILRLMGTADIGGAGNSRDNLVIGNDGNNTLYGRQGDDTLIGGLGADVLVGNDGADRFVYLTPQDSTPDAPDHLGFFEPGIDVIDLSAVAPVSVDLVVTTNAWASPPSYTTITVTTQSGATMVIVADNIVTMADIITDPTMRTGTIASDVITGTALSERFDLSQGGNDTVDGAGGDDQFVFGSTFTAADSVNGGSGDDRLVLQGDYGGSHALRLGAATLVGVERIDLLAGEGARYVITTVDANVAAGVRLTVDGSVLGVNSPLIFDGSAERDGAFTLIGGRGADVLTGGAGDDLLDGRNGADRLVGGAGNDSYYVDNAGDEVIENSNEGIDTVNSWISFNLSGQFIENLTLLGSANLNATGNGLANVLTGNAGNNVLSGLAGNDILDGGAGADQMIGGTGDDIYYVDNAGDGVIENSGEGFDTVNSWVSFTLATGQSVEQLVLLGSANLNATGNDLSNTLIGNAGNNVLDGRGGNNTLAGGLGDDIYYVASDYDVVIERNNEGTDEVRASTSFNLSGQFIERLTLLGNGNLWGTGNGLDNVITGNSGNNILNGLGGDDILNGGFGDDLMIGGTGNDTYYVSSAGDGVIENKNEGYDTVYTSISFSLAGQFIERLILKAGWDNINATGNSLDNVLIGNEGNNILNGMGGGDRMEGGNGDDIYYVDNAGDMVIEAAGISGGYDIVRSTVSFSAVGQSIERLELLGSADIHGTGNELNNYIVGNDGRNVLSGGAGNDYIVGGAGADAMYGGVGDDIFIVDDIGDQVFENNNEGNDAVYSSVEFNLSGQFIERLALTGAANINATGNGLDNILSGNSGDNILNGLGGADSMAGGAGNDTYYVDNAGDIVLESNGEGNDTVISTVSYSLAGQFIENLIVTGSANLSVTGNNQNNYLEGNFGNNVINGGQGNDRLDGGAGIDTLIGGTGADHFIFDTALSETNYDFINDFSQSEGDKIDLDNAIFTALSAPGALAAGAFYTGNAAHDADDRIIYDPITGWLYYDADGNGAGAAQHFATIAAGLPITASDFVVV